jgi:hypothetical protein
MELKKLQGEFRDKVSDKVHRCRAWAMRRFRKFGDAFKCPGG